MSFLQALILGIIQGLTEFLPISSTAHLTLAGKLMGLIDPAKPEEWTAFIAIIQLGTVAAVIIYFLPELIAMVREVYADIGKRAGSPEKRWGDNSRLAGQIIIGTIPVVVLGLAFKKIIEGNLTKTPEVIGTSLIVLALILLWAEKAGKRNRTNTTWKDGLIVGIAQSLALIPGSSRSGTTITAGLFLGFAREMAARFSFLLSIPAVLASGLYELYSIRHELTSVNLAPLLIATVVSGIVGYATIAFLLRYLKTHSTFVFIWYRIVLGAALWILVIENMI
jgi:undecaprenyl-diphosphatase